MKSLLFVCLLFVSEILLAQPTSTSLTAGSYAVPDGSGNWLEIQHGTLTDIMDSYVTCSGEYNWSGLHTYVSSAPQVGDIAALKTLLDGYTPVPNDFQLGGPRLCCTNAGENSDMYCWSYNCANCDCNWLPTGGWLRMYQDQCF